MFNDDEYLERIVAGIQAVTTSDAEVSWNEKINDRQFDVVVRFEIGSLKYLVVFEVKNKTRKVSASDLDAFTQKSRDNNANKSVFVSKAGFQSGAIKVASRHGVDIFTVRFDDQSFGFSRNSSYMLIKQRGASSNSRPSVEIGQPTLVNCIEKIKLIYSCGGIYSLPSEQSQMNYYVKKTRYGASISLAQLLDQFEIKNPAEGEVTTEVIYVQGAELLTPPDDYYFPKGILSAIEITVVGLMSRPIRGNMKVEPSSLSASVIYRNEATGAELNFLAGDLPLGHRIAEVGKFYFLPHPLRYFYCDSIINGTIRWHMIESFQSGEKITSTLTQSISYSPYYIEVTDKETLARLKRRLADHLQLISNESP